MKNLTTLEKLIRLKSKTLDERKQFVGKLVGRVAEAESEMQGHRDDLQKEQKGLADSLEGIMAFNQYKGVVTGKVDRLKRLHQEANDQLAKEQDKLRTLYADLHAHEKVLETAKKEHQDKLDKKEQNVLDELYARP